MAMEARYITILNKLPRKDSITGLDVWYKTILENIPYKLDKVTDVSGMNVSMGQSFKILLPFSEEYLPYEEWKNKPTEGYTISQGDYIFIGAALEEDVTPSNVVTLKNKYEPNVCKVRVITEVTKRYNTSYQLMIEGV